MHRVVINVPENLLVDHINRNKLDNRKANLRPATTAQNTCNQAKRKSNNLSSKYKGVTWQRGINCWQSQIGVNGNTIYLGSFDSEIRAAKAYDRAARMYHKEFAVLNFPERKRPLSCIVPLIAGVLLTYFVYFSNRLMFIQSRYAHPSPSSACHFAAVRRLRLPHVEGAGSEPFAAHEDRLREKNPTLCHPERSEEPALSLSKESRHWRFYKNAPVTYVPEALRFFAPLRSAQNDKLMRSARNDNENRI